MKAIDQPFTKIINGTTQYAIPVFQRDYSWTEAECEQLWKDVITVAEAPKDRRHFLGSLVYISTGDTSAGFTRWLLIDGQQRVTTLVLLLIALRDHISATQWEGDEEDSPTAKKIETYFLKNSEEKGSRRYKLMLRRHDQSTLGALLDQAELPRPGSEHVRENYEFFRDRLKESGVSPASVYRGIGRLVIVDVTLDRSMDDPQLVFESLNSTGMDLSQADLIRNFILMRLPEQEQTRLYEAYWSKIEGLFRGSEKTFDAFIRDYIALRTQGSKQEKADQIYFAFRRMFNEQGFEASKLEELLKDLLRFARYHAAFSIGAEAPAAFREPLARLRHLVDVPAILVMRLYECFEALHTLKEEEFVKAITLLESYIFRRAICGAQTRGYWQVFANLAYAIEADKPFETFAVGLARLRDNYRFPEDAEFQKALEEGDIYGKRVCFHLLDRLENHGSKEPSDTSRYSVEHILPQNKKLPRAWQTMLGKDWQDVQRAWLHRLGNLTLTGYNSKYSDRPFDEKKTIPNGFEESAVRLNKFVREQPVWTAAEMEKRGKKLARQALTIWPFLEVDQALVEAADQIATRARAQERSVEAVPMLPEIRELFEALRKKVQSLGDSIIEVAEQKSVSYHDGADFFLEVIPRKNRLTLILALDYNKVDDASGLIHDAAERKFIINAVNEGGIYFPVFSEADIDRTLPLIRQAWELTKT